MNKNVREILNIILNDFVFSQIIVFQLTLCLAVCIFSDCFNCYSEQGRTHFESKYLETNYHQITDRFVGEEEKFLYSDDALNKLILFYNRLNSTEKFEYLSLCNQFVYIKDFKGTDVFCYGYEFDGMSKTGDLSGIKTLWCDENVFDSSGLTVSKGKPFDNNDCIVQDPDCIPIILSCKYMEYYNIDDIIEGVSVIGNTFDCKFKVVGFLEKNSTITYRSQFLNLDYYLLIPFNKSYKIPSSEQEKQSMIRKFIMLSEGVIISNESPEKVQTYINQFCNELKIEPSFVITGANNQMAEFIHTDIKECNHLLNIIAVTLLVFSCGSMIMFLAISIKRNIRNFSILLISGFNYYDIMKIILGQSIVYQTEALFFGICTSVIVCNVSDIPYRLRSVIYAVVISTVISVVSSLTAYFNFSKYDLSEYLRKR